MRKLKKGFVLTFVAAMAMMGLAGCGDDSKAQTGTLNSTATSTDASDNESEESSMTIDEYIDYYAAYTTLGQYTGIEYEYAPAEPTDEEVQSQVQKLIDSNVTYEEDYESAAQIGDTVNIDFVGSIDGVEFDGGNSQGAGYDLVLGSGSFIDDFEDQIAGHVPGETFDVEVTFPETYGSDELNGKDAVFVTTLNYIKIPVEVEYNDEFVAANTTYSNVADYEEAIYNEISESNEQTALASAQNFIMVSVINNATIETIPEDEVTALTDEIVTALQNEATSYGYDYETYVYYFYGYDDTDAFYEYVKAVCEETIKEKIVVCAIAKKENISITAEEEDAYVTNLAEINGVTEDDIREYYAGEDLMYYALAEKVMDFLMENGVVVSDAEATETE